MNRVCTWFRGDPIFARKLQSMVDAIKAARTWSVAGNAKFIQSNGGQALYIPFGYGKSFTISISGSNVAISAGYVTHGQSVYAVPAGSVEPPEDAGSYWVYHRLYISSGTWQNEYGVTEDDSYPGQASNEFVTVLRKVTRGPDTTEGDPGPLSLAPEVNHDGDIHVRGAFAP